MGRPFLILFDRRHKILLLVLGLFFALGLLFRLHGYSLSQWHEYIADGSTPSEVLIGSSRDIRSDDFDEALPFIFSQERASFPIVNPFIGDRGQNMLITLHSVPVWHWVTMFRPKSWGYFAGPDFGMAWNWWLNYFGLLYGFFLLFLVISRNNFWLSLSAAVTFIYSAFFQSWAFYFTQEVIWMAFACVGLHQLLVTKGRLPRTIWSIVFLYSIGVYAFQMYPPTQIGLFYAAFALIVGLSLRSDFLTHARFRNLVLPVCLTIIVIGATALLLFHDSREAISLLLNSVYPGHRRVETGGGMPFFSYLGANFSPRLFLRGGDWAPFSNICEGSGFFLFAPLVLICAGIDFKKRRAVDPLVLMVGFVFLMESIWMVTGLPAFIAKIFLFDRAPPPRFMNSLGVSSFVLTVAYLSCRPQLSYSRLEKWLLLGIWGAVHLFCGLMWHESFNHFYTVGAFFGTFFAVLFGYLFLEKSPYFFFGLALLSFVVNGWINPLARGGSTFLYSNRLSKKMMELDASSTNRSKWVVYNSFVLPDLPRALGIHSINGMLYIPQVDFWKQLDP
jgi:hypothetical protein